MLLRENPLVLTGLGAYSAGGDSVEALWQTAVQGQSQAAWAEFEIGQKRERFAVCRAPELEATRPELHAVRKMDRCVQMALLAAHQAVAQAGLKDAYDAERVGIMVGSSRGPFSRRNETLDMFPNGRFPPTLSANSTFASLSGALAQVFKFKGPGATISATCASSAFAIAMAAEQILMGKVDAMLVGGTEAPLHHAVLAQLHASGVLGIHEDPKLACRPFDSTRNGLVLGEGSAFLILESARAAAARGALPLARLTGWNYSLAYASRTGVAEDGAELQRVMAQALELAGLPAGEIDYVNAHGTGTKMNDAAEAKAVSQLLGVRAASVPCSSTKPITGHCLGATSALESVISIMAMQRQIIPPTANCLQVDPMCPIQPQALIARPASIRNVLSNSLGFWGYHAALIFSQPKPH